MIHAGNVARKLIVIAVAICFAVLGYANRSWADEKEGASVGKDRVSVEIDFGDGSKRIYTAIPWKAKLTVQEAMEVVAKHPHGVRFEHRGAGATAFLTQLDDQKNEDGGGRNWVFKINGKSADRSFGIRELDGGDTVLWKFEVYR